ncbi:MAG: hypothetical protein K6T55_06750 [Syntrophobacterales bacterium]|jgi:hypothetical protein|nr:hypothetical protein [Syntrophobacterales bacterium]
MEYLLLLGAWGKNVVTEATSVLHTAFSRFFDHPQLVFVAALAVVALAIWLMRLR